LACGGGWLVVACCRAGVGVWSAVLLACGLAVWPAPCCRSCARACPCWLLRGRCWPAPGAHGQPVPACLLPIWCNPAGGVQPGDLGAGADGLRRYRSGRGLLSLPLPGLPSFRPGCRREGFYAPGLVS